MRRLTIRGIDDGVYRRLEALARDNRRSIEDEARIILQKATRPGRSDLARRAAEIRARLAGRYTGDSTAEIRADRG